MDSLIKIHYKEHRHINVYYRPGEIIGNITNNKKFIGSRSEHYIFKTDLNHYVCKYFCGFLNSSQAGTFTLYFGVNDDGTVVGIECNQMKEDVFRLTIDQSIRSFHPPLLPQDYSVYFVPVFHQRINLGDRKVIAISVDKFDNGHPPVLYKAGNKVYIRRDGSIQHLTQREIIEWYEQVAAQQLKDSKGYSFPGMDDEHEFHELMSKGTFASYSNVVFLCGACNVGKSTLASILIGEEIPKIWESTESLEIFFGQFGIDLEKREMVSLPKVPGNREIIKTVLLGQPNMEAAKQTAAEINIHKFDETKSPKLVKEFIPSQKHVPRKENQSEAVEKEPLMTRTAGSPCDTSVLSNFVNQKMKMIQVKNYLSIHQDIKNELRKGNYKVKIAPSDLVDFGGQRSFDMTHQLFIRQKGVFVLMIDGRRNLFDILEEYPQGDVTNASILLHWVNSILTYCGVSDDDILPLIIFVATHSDSFSPKELKTRHALLSQEIAELFRNHESNQRIQYETLYFINGTDKNDKGIEDLKAKLVETAFQQRSWGQELPMAWVPLDLQIAEMRSYGISLISIDELFELNENNGDLSITEKQLEHFINSQHSLGKILYFDLPGLERFIIIQPKALVDILRSFVTDEMFWPNDDHLQEILRMVKSEGRISKQDLLVLWSQKRFYDFLPTVEIMEYVSKVLVQLDILIEPKRYKPLESSKQEFLVPCIVSRRVNHAILDNIIHEGRTICLSYKLIKSDIPSALAYKLIGALLNIWPVKETDQCIFLFHKAAMFTIDGGHELYICMTENQIVIYLTNSTSTSFISPDIASIVKECVDVALEKILQFYHTNSGNLAPFDLANQFTVELGERCHGDDCFISVMKANELDSQNQSEWECKHKKHKTKTCLLWIHDKEECSEDCEGRFTGCLDDTPEDKHLIRLAQHMIDDFYEFILHMGLSRTDWKDIQNDNEYPKPLTKRFIALSRCRDQGKTFRDFSEAMKVIKQSDHILCQVFLDGGKEVLDEAIFQYQVTPDDEVLKALSENIGNYALPLGVELGLKLPMIERIVYNSKDMFRQNLGILQEWKNSGNNKTALFLMKALYHADRRGYTFLQDVYK